MVKRGRRKETVLIVDDDNDVKEVLVEFLKRQNYRIYSAGSGEAALDVLSREDINVLVTDIYMPGIMGIELMQKAKTIHPDIQCIVITGKEDVQSSIEAMRQGAINSSAFKV